MVLLRLFDYQGALTVRYHRLRSFYRRRLFAAYDCDIFLMFIAPGCFCVHGEGEDIKHFSVYIKNHHMPEHFSDVISDTKTICILILKCGDGICKVMFYFQGCKKKFHM